MNKAELVDAIAERTDGLKKTEITAVINTLFDTIQEELARDGRVQLIGFGSFATAARAARTGRDPRTGEPLQIPATKVVKFTAGKAFKGRVNADTGRKKGKGKGKKKK